MSPAADPLRQSLDVLSRAWWRVRWARVLARTAAVVAGVLLAWALVDWLRPLGRWPLIASGLTVALVVVAAAWWIRRRSLAHPTPDRMARLVEEQCPELEATLRTALDPSLEQSPFGPVVRDDAATALARLDEARVIDPDDRRRAWLWAGGALAAVLVAAGLAAPTAVRAARTARFVVAPPEMALRVTPGNRRIVKGTALTIAATVEGAPPDLDVPMPQLIVQGDGARAVGAFTRTPQGAYQVRIASVDRDFSYRVRAGGLDSNTYTVEALDRPRILGIDLAYVYPSFSGLEPRTEADTGDIYAPAGTKVTVKVRTSKPLRAAQLRSTDGDGAKAVPLQVTGTREGEVALTIARDGAYRIALTDTDAIENGEETEYFIRVMDDRPPDVRIIRPAGDRGATRLEEVALEARAEDDYGVQALELVYAVRGGPERVVPLGGNGRSTAVSGKHTIYLEDLDVKPGDFVNYYARARDIGRGKRSTEARSDIFFLEIKPTAQEFTAAQSSAGMGGGGGGEMTDLVAAQKDVVSATWKLERRSSGGRSSSDIRAVSRAQAEVREKLRQAAANSGGPPAPRRRRGVEPEPEAPPVPLQAAGEAMEKAVTQLDKLDTRSAITHEMEALNQLLRAEAEIRRRQLARQQGGGGGGRGRSGNEDLSALFDQELMRQQTNYEQQSSVESREDAKKGESALDRIRELARRQDDLAREQQQLARERSQLTAEEAKRRLERLTREQQRLQQEAQQLAQQMQNGQQGRQSPQGQPQSGQQGQQSQGQQAQSGQQGQQGQQGQSGQSQGQSQGQQASGGQSGASAASRDRLREAAQQMGEATSQLQQQSPDQAAARGSRSAQALRDAERALQAGTPGERQRAAGDVQLEARELAEAQRQLAQQSGELGTPQSGATANERRRQLAGEQGRLADRVASLERQVRELARGADPGRDALGQAARELQRGKTAEQLQQAARQLREGGTPQGTDIARQQRDAARVLDRVSSLAAQAGGRATGDTQALSSRLADTRDLRDRLKSLEDRIASLAQQAEREAAGADGKGDGKGEGKGKSGDRPGQQQQADASPQGQDGAPRGSQPGGRNQSPGQQGQGQGQGQGNGEGRGDTLDQLRQLQAEYARELQQAGQMMQGSNAGGADRGGRMSTPEGHEFSRSAPGTEAFKQDFARWESLKKGIGNAMDRYEASLAQRLAEREAAERVQAPLRDKVPDRYAESVVRYYQSLSRRPESR